MRLRVPDEGATVVARRDPRRHALRARPPRRSRDRPRRRLGALQLRGRDRRPRRRHHARGARRGPPLQHRPSSCSCSRRCAPPASARTRRCPLYAHLPLLHGPDGKKLSKRHGAASVQELRDAGYLPEAVRNYLALLGWGAGDDATVLSTEELIERFTLERVSRNPARFDEVKLRWLERPATCASCPSPELTAAWKRSRVARAWSRRRAISQEKIQTLADFWPLAGSLLDGPRRGSEGARALAGRGRTRGAGRGATARSRSCRRASTRRRSSRRSRR